MAKKKKAEKPRREFTRRQISSIRKQRRRQRLIFFGGIAVIAAVVIIVVIGWLMGEYIPLHKTVLKVNDTEIKVGYYVEVLEMAQKNQPNQDIRRLAQMVLQQMQQEEVIRQKAAALGFTVSDEEVIEGLEQMGLPVNDGYIGTYGVQLLISRLKATHFGLQVPQSAEQVHVMAMLLESESQALEIREQIVSSGNFTGLAEKFALDYYAQNVNQGDYGWHPRSIYEVQLGSEVAIEYAFSAEPGTLSEPLFDEEKQKQLGYWLIRVNDYPEEESANVSAVYLSSEEEALEIKARLEAGEDLGPIADEYSDYSLSQEKHGELGYVMPEQMGDTFDAYVFQPGVELGKWSEPIRDENYWTKGGYWLVEVVDREDDRKISEEDRNYLIDDLFTDWVNSLYADPFLVIDDTYLTEELNQWVIDRVTKSQTEAEGQ